MGTTFEWGNQSRVNVDADPDGTVNMEIGGDEPGKPYETLTFTPDEWARFLAVLNEAR
jgi:hypothetical protein